MDEEDSPKIIIKMEGSWAEPGQRDLGLKILAPDKSERTSFGNPGTKGACVTVGRHPRHLSSMTSMAGFIPTVLSALKGQTLLYVLQPMAASRRPRVLPV